MTNINTTILGFTADDSVLCTEHAVERYGDVFNLLTPDNEGNPVRAIFEHHAEEFDLGASCDVCGVEIFPAPEASRLAVFADFLDGLNL
jgi:hypothetical protein